MVYDKINIDIREEKWPFVVSALVSFSLPIIPVIVVFRSQEGYVSFYSCYCFPGSTQLTYYTAILPENILFAIGVSFLYLVIWKLLKVSKIMSHFRVGPHHFARTQTFTRNYVAARERETSSQATTANSVIMQ